MTLSFLSQIFKRAFQGWSRENEEGLNRSPNKRRGESGELEAYRCLRKNGYEIVARNYRKRFGEIDLIGWDKGVLAFIEVKFRTGQEHGRPEEAVNLKKQKQIRRVAREYRNSRHLHDINYRFDIVSIQGTPGQAKIHILKDAFKERP